MRKKLALSAASILFTLLLAEAALRILGIGSAGRGSPWFAGGNHPRFLFQPDAESGYALRPSFRGQEIAEENEFNVPVAIDGRGLREQPHAAPPAPVVLAVGDSMTFGEGVPAGGTFSAVIEREAGVRVENAGVPGYSSRQMVGRLRHFLPAIRPAVVIMTLSPLWDRTRCAAPFVYRDGYIVAQSYVDRLELIGGNLYLKETRLPVLGTLTAELKGHSNLMRLAIPVLADRAKKLLHHSKDEDDPFDEKAPPTAADYEPTVQALAEAHRLTQAQGAAFLALFVDDRGKDYKRDRQAVQQRLRELDIPFVAANQLLPGPRWKPLRYPLDTHWNPAGHEAVGKALAPRIKEMAAGHNAGS
jgi:lysophospholipase L1-like esterase